MDAEEFVRAVEVKNAAARSRRVSVAFIKAALFDVSLEEGRATRADVQRCLATARAMEESTKQAMEADQKTIPPTDPEIDLMAGRLFKQLEASVARLREELFETNEIPFHRWDDAVKWIRQNEHAHQVTYEESEVIRLCQKGAEVCEELSRLADTGECQGSCHVKPHYAAS